MSALRPFNDQNAMPPSSPPNVPPMSPCNTRALLIMTQRRLTPRPISQPAIDHERARDKRGSCPVTEG